MFGKLPSQILRQTVVPPATVAKEAAKGLLLRKRFKRGGTAVGVRRAVQLSKREPVSIETVQRMHSFFSRHAVNKRPGWDNPDRPSNGYIAWLLWGGDAGWDWAIRVLKSVYRISALSDVVRTYGYTKLPVDFWNTVFNDPSVTSVERMKEIISVELRRREAGSPSS